MTAMSVVQEEFARFAADMVGERRPVSGHRGPQHSITAQFIYEYALELVDCEGIEALTVLRLASELKISTRTLYKRIGSRTDMLGELVDAIATQGVPRGVAVECCWSLADLMVNDAMGAAREMTSGDAPAAAWSSVQPSQRTADAIKWILRGVGAVSVSSTSAGDGL